MELQNYSTQELSDLKQFLYLMGCDLNHKQLETVVRTSLEIGRKRWARVFPVEHRSATKSRSFQVSFVTIEGGTAEQRGEVVAQLAAANGLDWNGGTYLFGGGIVIAVMEEHVNVSSSSLAVETVLKMVDLAIVTALPDQAETGEDGQSTTVRSKVQ